MSKLTLNYYKVALVYSAWWIIWTFDQAFVLHQTGFNWSIAFTDAAVTQLVMAIAGYVINTSMHYYQPNVKNALYVFVYCNVLAALCVLLQRGILLQLLGNDADYVTFLSNSLIVRGGFAMLMVVMVAVLTWSWVYVRDHEETEKRKQDSERLAREAELASLRLQLQPHFLFNSLNSISALIGTKPELARKMIHQLSDFLRGTIRKEDGQLVPLSEELTNLQLYLDIEKVRFGHRLVANVETEEECLNMKIPSLLLQPVVENAIKFGLYDNVGEVVISIRSRNEKGALLIEIQNPYDPATSAPRKGTGFGLSAIQRRLYLLFAQQDLLQTSQHDSVFTTSIKIPQRP